MNYKQKLIIVLISLLCLQLVGCSQQSKDSQQQSNQLPVSLLNVEVTVERVIDDLESFYLNQKEKQKQQSAKQQEKKSNSKSKPEDSKQTAKTQTEVNIEQWKQIEQQIKKLHQNWNKYESKSSVQKQSLHLIEEPLYKLTEVANQQRLLQALARANQFSLNLANLQQEYKPKLGIVKKIIGRTRRVIYLSRAEAITRKKLAEVEKIEELVTKLAVKQVDDSNLQELQEAVQDLKIAVNKEAREVIEVKGELILTKVRKIKDNN